MVEAVVREWHGEEGWGVLDSPETPGGCWAHFGSIQMEGYHELHRGQRVTLVWEEPGQDGFPFRAVRVVPGS
jgi:cold shock protein